MHVFLAYMVARAVSAHSSKSSSCSNITSTRHSPQSQPILDTCLQVKVRAAARLAPFVAVCGGDMDVSVVTQQHCERCVLCSSPSGDRPSA